MTEPLPLFECDGCYFRFHADDLNEDDLCKDCALDKKAHMINETGPYFRGRERKDMMDPQNE